MSCDCQAPRTLDAAAINDLKEKIIEDYTKFVKKLNVGYRIDYSTILNEINFVDTYLFVDNSRLIYENYMNYGL